MAEMADALEKDGKTSAESNQGALADGLMQVFRPAVEELDNKVISVRYHDAARPSGKDKIMFQFPGHLQAQQALYQGTTCSICSCCT